MLGKKKHKKYESEVTDKFSTKAPKPLERVEPLNTPDTDIIIDKASLEQLSVGGFSIEWLMSLANRYNFDKIEYMAKFTGFRCYIDGRVVDTITANDLASLNDNKRLIKKDGLAFRHVPKKQQVIQIPWRK